MLIFPVITVVLSIVHTMEAQRSEFKNVIRVADNNPQRHCRKGQYFSSSRNACVTCSRCDLFSVKVADCNATTDTVCVKCLSDTGDARVKFKDPVCTFCKPCGPGEYVKRPCDPRRKKKTKCKACEQGSFKVMKSFSTHCVPCTDCGNMKIKTECTNTTDTECGQCKPGHFLDKSRNICHRCRSCMPNEKTIEECQQGHKGKHCGGIYLRPISYENSFAGEDVNKTVAPAVTDTSSQSSVTTPSDTLTSGRHLEEMALLIAVISLILILVAVLAVPIVALAFRLRATASPAVIAKSPPGSWESPEAVLRVTTAGDPTPLPLSKSLEKNNSISLLVSNKMQTAKNMKIYLQKKLYTAIASSL